MAFARAGGGTVDTGIFTLNIAADGTASNLNRLVSWGGASGIQNPYGIAIDNTNSLLFITDFGDSHNTGQAFNPRIEVANLNTGVILNSNLQSIDASAELIPPSSITSGRSTLIPPPTRSTGRRRIPNVVANNQILTATYTTGATPTLGAVTALYTATSAGPLPEAMAIDVANGVYYVALSSSTATNGSIVEGSLSTANGTQTTIYTLPTNTQPQDILFEGAPVLTAGRNSRLHRARYGGHARLDPDAWRIPTVRTRQRARCRSPRAASPATRSTSPTRTASSAAIQQSAPAC